MTFFAITCITLIRPILVFMLYVLVIKPVFVSQCRFSHEALIIVSFFLFLCILSTRCYFMLFYYIYIIFKTKIPSDFLLVHILHIFLWKCRYENFYNNFYESYLSNIHVIMFSIYAVDWFYCVGIDIVVSKNNKIFIRGDVSWRAIAPKRNMTLLMFINA